MKYKINNNILISFSLLIVLSFFSCEKKLDSSGVSSIGHSKAFTTNDSIISVYTNFYTYPKFLTQLESSNPVVPRELLVPIIEFGEPQVEYLHTDRTISNTPQLIDMIIVSFNPKKQFKDFYYEAPVLGAKNTISNSTTALSWILRFGFNSEKVKISKNSFDSIITKIDVSCMDCLNKSNTEMVEYLLNNSVIAKDIIDAVKKDNSSNTNLQSINSINYQPPESLFAYSFPQIGKNWEIIQVMQEPTEYDQTKVQTLADVILIKPTESTQMIRPSEWSHSAKLFENYNEPVNLENIEDTPLIYTANTHSAGLHTFNSQFDNLSSPPSIKILLTVQNANINSNCFVSGTVTHKAGRQIRINVNQTIEPEVLNSLNTKTERVTTSEVGIKSIIDLISISTPAVYRINFTHTGTYGGANYAPSYSVTKTLLSNNTTTTILNSRPFISGRVVYFDNLSINLSGTPMQGDYVTFTVPTHADTTKFFSQQVGCLDPDISKAQDLTFELFTGPTGLNISSDGLISWTPNSTTYTSDTTSTSVKFYVKETGGLSQLVTLYFNIQKDYLPVACVTEQLISDPITGQTRCPFTNDLTQLPLSLPSQVFTPPQANSSPFSYLNSNNDITYAEGRSIQQRIYFFDPDGDPLLTTNLVSRIQGNIINPNNTNSQSITNIISTPVTVRLPNATTNSTGLLYQMTWNFKPDSAQVTTTASSTLTFAFNLRYNTNENPLLDSNLSILDQFKIYIGDSIGVPGRTASTETCNGTPCVATVAGKNYFIPQYRLYPSSLVSADTTTSSLNLTGYVFVDYQRQNLIQEGSTATIEVPIKGTVNTPMATPIYKIGLNSLGNTNNNNQCLYFVRPGYTRIQEVSCENSSNAANKDCLRISFLVDPYTNNQMNVPSAMPSFCSINLTVHDSSNPGSKAVIFGSSNVDVTESTNPSLLTGYRPLLLHFKNINRAPTLQPASIRVNSIETATNSYPVEGSSFNLKPTLDRLFYDPDLGGLNAYSGSESNPYNTDITKFNLNLTTDSNFLSSTTHRLATFHTAYMKPTLHLFDTAARGTNFAYQFETSTDGTTYSALPLSQISFGNYSSYYLITNLSNDFNGTLLFERTTTSSPNTWTSAQILRVSTNTTVTSTNITGENLFIVPVADPAINMFRVRVINRTTGTASVRVLSDYNFESEYDSTRPVIFTHALRTTSSTVDNPTSIPISTTDASIPIIFRRINQTTDLANMRWATQFFIDLTNNDNYIRINYVKRTGGNFLGTDAIPTTLQLNRFMNVDPIDTQAKIDCWLKLGTNTPQPCTSMDSNYGSGFKLLNFLSTNFTPLDRLSGGQLTFIPFFSSAVNNNLNTNSQRDSQIQMILRYRDSANLTNPSSYVANYCDNAANSCVEQTVNVPIIETITQPTIKITVLRNGATFKDIPIFNPTLDSANKSVNIVNSDAFMEGQTAKLQLEITPFNDDGYTNFTSPHDIGKYSYTVAVETCEYLGKPCTDISSRQFGIYAPPGDQATDADKDRDGNMLTDNTDGVTGKGKFNFYFSALKGDAERTLNGGVGELGEYTYRIRITPDSSTGLSSTLFSVRIKVLKNPTLY